MLTNRGDSYIFRAVRYQTGEMEDILREMKRGNIPCVDVDNIDELNWFIKELEKYGVFAVEGLPYDKDARDRVREPEFEFRTGFYTKPAKADEIKEAELIFIDFYFEPDVEETYDSIGEI